jgi:hypothetical protein
MTWRDARERAQPAKLDLFRSCSDASRRTPPELDDDAVGS